MQDGSEVQGGSGSDSGSAAAAVVKLLDGCVKLNRPGGQDSQHCIDCILRKGSLLSHTSSTIPLTESSGGASAAASCYTHTQQYTQISRKFLSPTISQTRNTLSTVDGLDCKCLAPTASCLSCIWRDRDAVSVSLFLCAERAKADWIRR